MKSKCTAGASQSIYELRDQIALNCSALVCSTIEETVEAYKGLDAKMAEAAQRVMGNRDPEGDLTWPDLHLLACAYLRVGLEYLESKECPT